MDRPNPDKSVVDVEGEPPLVVHAEHDGPADRPTAPYRGDAPVSPSASTASGGSTIPRGPVPSRVGRTDLPARSSGSQRAPPPTTNVVMTGYPDDEPASPNTATSRTAVNSPTTSVRSGKVHDPVLPPTSAGTHPAEQREALKHADPHVVRTEIEKTRAEQRALMGEEPEGTVVEGIEDNELWALLRRFNNQVNHVLSPATDLPPKEPDLRMTTLPDVPYRSDTLKSNFERVVAAIMPPSVRGFREFERLTDWETETMRTAGYCAGYFVSWVLGCTVIVATLFFVVLIAFPDTRRYLFPAPKPPPHTAPSATDPTHQRGDESLIGSVGGKAQHRSRTEQAEQQAFEARAVFEAYTQAVVLGGHKGGKKGNGKVGAKDPNATAIGEPDSNVIRDRTGKVVGHRVPLPQDEDGSGNVPSQGTQSADIVVGGETIQVKDGEDVDKVEANEVKRKRDELVAKMAKGTEVGLGTVADYVEILQNAMSPPPVYPDHYARFKIAALFLLPALGIHFVPARLWGRIVTFSFGAALWGRPLAIRGIHYIVGHVHNLREILDPRNSILSGTPTNAQLTIHLLRVSEDIDDPLPPPPEPPVKGATKEALKDTSPADNVQAEQAAEEGADDDDDGAVQKAAKKHGAEAKHRLAGAFKKVSRKLAGFRGDVAVDGKHKKVSSKSGDAFLRRKFGEESPDAYVGKLDGTPGHFIIDDTTLRVAWVSSKSEQADERDVWDIDDIVELQKDAVSVTRMAMGWLGGADVESLGITVRFAVPGVPLTVTPLDKKTGPEGEEEGIYHFTSVQRRDQLFNRLISMGAQRWEIL